MAEVAIREVDTGVAEEEITINTMAAIIHSPTLEVDIRVG